jgi:hypothetical protein
VSTRYCPDCGAEYVATVTMCVDCLVPLLDDVEAEQRRGEIAEDAAEQTAYELAEWDPDNRVLLARLLDSEGIPHAWEATDLVIRQSDEARVEALMDEIEAPADEGEQVVYELSDWAPDLKATLVGRLDEAMVRYGWDENGDLVVEEADEDVVEALLDELEFPDALPADDEGGGNDDGPSAADVMSDLFVAADRLKNDPRDHEGVLGAFDGAQAAAALSTPYGFSDESWRAVVSRAGALRDALEGDVDDLTIEELATELRALLRQYV